MAMVGRVANAEGVGAMAGMPISPVATPFSKLAGKKDAPVWAISSMIASSAASMRELASGCEPSRSTQ